MYNILRVIFFKSGLLGSDEFVDFRAEILQNEISFSIGFAFVYFLCPLFKWNLDAEFFINRENDIKEIKAINAQIVNCVAFRRDGSAVNFAGFSNNISYFVKC